jgi:integrase
VVENWRKRHVEANGLRSAAEINRLLDVHVLPKWKDREFTAIRRSDVAALLDEVEDGHSARQADYVLNVVRSIMFWYASRNDDYTPPIVRGMKRQKVATRARVLDDAELRAIWGAAEANGTFGALVRMCLLTAQRSRKVAAMKWDDIEDGEWSIPRDPREKETAGVLVLPAVARAIIKAQPQFDGNPYVFAGRGKRKKTAPEEGESKREPCPYQGFSAGKVALDAEVAKRLIDPETAKRRAETGLPPIPPWQLHDLRRTARSLMSRAGVRPDIAERVMGHAIGGVEGIYDRHSYRDEKADALAKLAALIDGIAHPRENVVAMKKARRK